MTDEDLKAQMEFYGFRSPPLGDGFYYWNFCPRGRRYLRTRAAECSPLIQAQIYQRDAIVGWFWAASLYTYALVIGLVRNLTEMFL